MNNAISKVFMCLFVGLMVTFVTGYVFSTNPQFLYYLYVYNLYWLVFIAELVLVGFLSIRISKMSFNTALISYISYSILTGITLSYIFVAYELNSIMYVIALASLIMLIFGAVGYFIKIDMSEIRNLLFWGLIALITANIINMFLMNNMIRVFDINIGLLLFMGFIIYDVQKIKQMANFGDNYAIYGALTLYLDFINIFIRLLSLTGDRKN